MRASAIILVLAACLLATANAARQLKQAPGTVKCLSTPLTGVVNALGVTTVPGSTWTGSLDTFIFYPRPYQPKSETGAPYAGLNISTWDFTIEYGVSTKAIYHVNGNEVNVKGKNIRDRYDLGVLNAAATAAARAALPATALPWTVEVYDGGLRRDSVAGYRPGLAPMPLRSGVSKFPSPLPGPVFACPINTVRSTTVKYVCGYGGVDALGHPRDIVDIVEVTPCKFTMTVLTPHACGCDSPLCDPTGVPQCASPPPPAAA